MSSRFCIILLIVKIIGNVSTLEELPQVEDNNILETDAAIRQTTNNLFSILKLKLNKERQILKQYSLIHNYLVSTSLHDYTNLIEIAKLTRVDKTKLNNETRNFITIVNEILDEDVKHIETEDEYIVKHIEGFLINFDKYTYTYDYNENNVDYILAEILKLLENTETFAEYNNTLNEDNDSLLELSDKNDTTIDFNGFWESDVDIPSRRIFQGKKTNIKVFPFLVSIQIFNHFQCAGSLIAKDLIITAASCLQLAWNNRFFRENPSYLSARVGSTFHNGGGEKIEIIEVYFHPTYDPVSLQDNLCIVRLWRWLRFNKKVRRIKIDRHANSLPLITHGITIVGWGARSQSNIIMDPFLSMAVLPIYPLKECRDIYSKKYVTRKHFCAGFMSKGGGACNRDIGGPGLRRSVLLGIASFGSPVCGTPDAPTVFVKLGFYADWIDSILEMKVPHNRQMPTTRTVTAFTVPINTEKTTFLMTPLVITKKRKIYLEDVETIKELRDRDLLKDFVNSAIGSEEAGKILRDANVTYQKIRTTPFVERIPFTYSAVTTLEPYAPSTAMSLMEPEEKSTETKTRNLQEKQPVDGTDDTSQSFESIEDQTEKGSTKIESHESSIIDDGQILEKDIVQIIDEIEFEEKEKKKHDIEIQKHRNKKDDAPLSELSDKETSSISDEEKDKGYSIESTETKPSGMVDDLTYRNNVSDFLISEQELFNMIYEVLKEELEENMTTKSVDKKGKTDITTTTTIKLDTIKTSTTNPSATKSSTTKPFTTKSILRNPVPTKPSTTKAFTTKHITTKPIISNPVTTKPSTTKTRATKTFSTKASSTRTTTESSRPVKRSREPRKKHRKVSKRKHNSRKRHQGRKHRFFIQDIYTGGDI